MKSMWFIGLGVIYLFSYNEASSVEFVNANNLFAASLYKEILSKKEPNFMLSPFSAETVLAFVQSGCKGETAQEIRSTLKLPDNKDRVENLIKQSLPLLNGNGNGNGNESYTLRSVNKMYLKNGFQINEEFEKAAVEVYQAGIEQIHFEKNVEAAKTMNEWVEKQTNNKIHNLIDKNDLDEFTRTVLINALYFKGNWSHRFSNYSTRKENFYKTLNDVTEVDTMHHYQQWFNYYEDSELNAKFLELEFEGGDISMIIILPNEKEGLASLENQIEKVFVPQKFTRELVNIAMPKFKINSKFSLKEALENLGVHKAFNGVEADLSGIAGKKGDLTITKVVQQSFIDVEEDGVEAAAATYVVVATRVKYEVPPHIQPKEFKADHPFIFYIKAKDFILFAGRVSAPDY